MLVFGEVVEGRECADNRTMPLPNDERIVALAEDMVKQFDALFGLHPGFRPVHAKGVLLTGVFTPSAEAESISRAPHLKVGHDDTCNGAVFRWDRDSGDSG